MAKILLMEGSKIRPIESSKFKEEAVLQSYLEQYPDLLPLDEVEDNPPPLLAIGREVAVPSGAIDLLFIDSDGLLTIVETKLATNPEVRRAVIGQIIEYASFVCQWDADHIERQANQYLASRTNGETRDLYQALKVEPDAEEVRAKLEENLRKGRIRLVIAVDELVEPLRSTVTFLNTFSTFDLLILQLRDFELDAAKHVFIPSLFGYSGISKTEKQRKLWDQASFLIDAKARRSPAEFEVIRELYDLAINTGRAQFGTGTSGGSFTYRVSADGKLWLSLITVFNYYGVQFSLGMLSWRGVPRELLAEFRDRVNAIPGVEIPKDEATLGKYPSIQFAPLTREGNLQRFKEALVWLRKQVLQLPLQWEAQQGT
jgi:hypothetical protein